TRSIDMLFGQSLAKDMELVVVDDGSSDATPELLQKAARRYPRLRPLRQKRLGIAHALNAGFAAASGDYIARMDVSDTSPSNRFELQIDFLERHQDVAAASGHIVYHDEAFGKERLLRMPLKHEDIFARLRNPCDFFSFVHAAAMFSRAALRKAGVEPLYRTHLRFAEDYDLWLRMSREVRFANLDTVLYRAKSPRASLRIMSPFLAFKGVIGAWLDDLLVTRHVPGLRVKDGCFARASDSCAALAPHPDLHVRALAAFLGFGWRLMVPPRLLAGLCRMAEASWARKGIADAALKEFAALPHSDEPTASTPVPPFEMYLEEVTGCCASI
ncbi:MAG: glycosyltransferase, partial [Desulfovibrionaceae bacterium]|nr:glycosyltransferase [Desulfovibrionaceae bacterium]